MLRALSALCLCALALAHPEYLALNPNGASAFGAELGHLDPVNPGARNPFGLAFAAAGKRWTRALCAADADGDGLSNGHELGDECCFWTSAASCNASVLVSDLATVSNPGDAVSRTARAACSCSAGAQVRCACCDLQPCSGGGSGGGGGDDDDDDDDDDGKLYIYGGAGAAALVVLGLGGYCFWRQRKAAAAAAREAEEEAGAGYESLLRVS